ncbi:MAG TPA: hypothetical protein PLZ55_03325 [bacterium]|nr:hypothetical protein [bacterium]HPO07674.1 hypothetical protein [bacterium]HQO35531.1 hypothetical protein [bacterium]HQP99392.1 hypothetical protein [bacterium]
MKGIDNWFQSSQVNPDILLGIGIGLAVLIFLLVYGAYLYQRRRHYKVFEKEMKSLDLEPNQENTLTEMVRRYSMNEPVQVLVSERLFDDLATREMRRILSGIGTIEAKEQYIDTLYAIRTKTYHPRYLTEEAISSGGVAAA